MAEIFPRMFGYIPGKRNWFWPVPGARNCVNVHLFIDIIHDCCNHMRTLVHLKQFNTNKHKHKSNWLLQYSFKAKKKCQNLACYPFHQILVMFAKIFNEEIVSEYTIRFNKSCVWISLNIYFWCYTKNPVFSFVIPDPALVLLPIFYQNTTEAG